MASQITDYGAEQWMGMPFGLVSVPTHYWIALASREPGTGIDGTMLAQLEPPVTAGSTEYARQSTVADTDWGLSDAGFVTNLNTIDFGLPDVSWGFTPYYAICSALTAGNLYAYGIFANPQVLGAGVDVSIPPGSIVFQAVSAQPSIAT